MRLLYVFPHPDDESFGPGAAMAQQLRQGHEVFLLVLTRGGATRVRHELGLSVEEMGALRAREMECVARVYGLTELTILDLPDGRLKELDPRRIEAVVAEAPGFVLVDEAYYEFNDEPSAQTLMPRYPNLVLMRTFSKGLGLAGLRLGYVLAQPEIVRELLKARLPVMVDRLSEGAGLLLMQSPPPDGLKPLMTLGAGAKCPLETFFTYLGLPYAFTERERSDSFSLRFNSLVILFATSFCTKNTSSLGCTLASRISRNSIPDK